jgi:hypothetical protein
MILPNTVRPGDVATQAQIADLLAKIIQAIKQNTVCNGVGTFVSQMPGGVSVNIKPALVTSTGAPIDDQGGTLKELAFTQGTQDADTWTRGTDQGPVKVARITDIEYDQTTHWISIRVRYDQFDKAGKLLSVSAESDLIHVTQAVPCPAAGG